jgi:hypothetical protein
VSRPVLGPTQSPVQWVPGVFSPGVKRGRGLTLITYPHLMPRSGMSRSYTSSPPSAPVACSGTAFYCNSVTLRQSTGGIGAAVKYCLISRAVGGSRDETRVVKRKKGKKHEDEVSFLLDISPPWEHTLFSFGTYTQFLSWPTLNNGPDHRRENGRVTK